MVGQTNNEIGWKPNNERISEERIKEQENKMATWSEGIEWGNKEQKSAGENIPFIKSIDKGFEEKDGENKEGKEREKYVFNRMNR